MQKFRYQGIQQDGKRVSGVHIAQDEPALLEWLSTQRIELLAVKVLAYRDTPHTASFMDKLFQRKANFQQRFVLLQQLAQLVQAEMAIPDIIEELIQGSDTRGLRNQLCLVRESILAGKSLSDSLAEVGHLLDPLSISMIRAGEANATLSTSLHDICQWYKWRQSVENRVKKLLVYPIILGVVILGVLLFLMIMVVPEILSFVTEFSDTPLNAHTKILVNISWFITAHWQSLIIGTVLFVLLWKLANRVRRLVLLKHRLTLLLPFVGDIYHHYLLAMFVKTLRQLLSTNVPLKPALELCLPMVQNRYIASKIERMIMDIAIDQSLAQSIQKNRLLPSLMGKIINTGEVSSNLDQALRNVSDMLLNNANSKMDRLEPMIEPTLTLILATIVGWVLWAVLNPIWNLMTRIG